MDKISGISTLVRWCEAIFPQDTLISSGFIKHLQPEGLKAAYREKAKENHPDKAKRTGIDESVLTERFRNITEAYESLLPFVSGQKSVDALLSGPLAGKENKAKRHATKKAPEGPAPGNGFSGFDFYHEGNVPCCKLRFGQYLYYKKVVSWRQCMQSLLWQRKERPLIGQLAIEWNYLKAQDVISVLSLAKPGESFGETALRIRLLSQYQILALLGRQVGFKARVGDFFIMSGLISEADLQVHLREFYFHNLKYSRSRN